MKTKTRNFAQLNSSLDNINDQMIAIQLANFAFASSKPIGSTEKSGLFELGMNEPERSANVQNVAVNAMDDVNKATAEGPTPEVTSNTVVNAVPKTQETQTPGTRSHDTKIVESAGETPVPTTAVTTTATENDPSFWNKLYTNLAGLVKTMGDHVPATVGIGAGVAGLTVGTVMLVKALKKKKLSNAKIKEAIINAGGTEEVADKLNEVSA